MQMHTNSVGTKGMYLYELQLFSIPLVNSINKFLTWCFTIFRVRLTVLTILFHWFIIKTNFITPILKYILFMILFIFRVVEFASYSDMKNAIEKLDGTDLNGRRIRLIEDKRRGSGRRSRSSSSRSRSRSRSRRRSRSRSRSR